MKLLLVVFVSLVALAACKPAEDAIMAKFLLRSCDRNADKALNAAEFAGCVSHPSWQRRITSERLSISRSELLQNFMDTADSNNDLRVDEEELHDWSSRWFLSCLFGCSNNTNNNNDTALTFNQILDRIVVILQLIGEGKYSDAAAKLYALVSGSDLSAVAKASVTLAIEAINSRRYAEAVGYLYTAIKDIAGGDEAGGIFAVSSSTVTYVASLLQAVIENNSANINLYIYKVIAGFIVDFSYLSQSSAGAVASLIQAVIENNTKEFYLSLTAVVNDIPGINTETATALVALLEAVAKGQSDQIAARIFTVLSSIFEDDNAAEIAQMLVAVIQAVLENNFDEAIKQLTLLYSQITGGSSGQSKFTSEAIIAFASIVSALKEGRNAAAIAQINTLLQSSSNEFSSAQITSLKAIIKTIEGNNKDKAIADLTAVATSSSSNSTKISVTVFAALSSVMILVESNDAGEAILLINKILVDTSINLTQETITRLKALVTTLAQGNTVAAIVELSTILAGAKVVYSGRILTAQVASQLKIVVTAINGGDLNKAITVITALSNGQNGGDSLSTVVKEELKIVIEALKKGDKAGAFAQTTIILVGKRSSMFSTSASAVLLVSIEEISTGSSSSSITKLERLLNDATLSSGLKGAITAIIQYIRDGQTAKALNAIVVAVLGSGNSINKSVARSLYFALQLSIAGDFAGAIEDFNGIFKDEGEDLDTDIRMLLLFIVQLLEQKNSQGAVAIINAIIVEAFGNNCFCN